jgi:hypothetical protein
MRECQCATSYRLRSPSLFLKSSFYHFLYMGSLIIGIYGAIESLSADHYVRFFVVSGGSLFCIVIVMWFDRKYGEKEESELINNNWSLFVHYVRAHVEL